MEMSTDSPRTTFYDRLPDDQHSELLKSHYDYYDHELALALTGVQRDMELREDYDHEKAAELGKEILANEDAAIEFDARENRDEQHAPPHFSLIRKAILRRTAVIYLYGRHIIPDYKESLDDCIQKYNELERQAPTGKENNPRSIGYEDIMEDYHVIRDRADQYLYEQRWTTKAMGKIGTALARLWP